MTKVEKVRKGLKCCIFSDEEGECLDECPYHDDCWETDCELGYTLKKDVLELLKAQEPRVISLDELNTTSGAGWLEVWLEGDPDEGMKEEKFLIECGWCKGNYITDDGDFSIADYIQTHYNKKYGIRIWTAKPTDEQREAVRWDDE